jgi:hypothetical protein
MAADDENLFDTRLMAGETACMFLKQLKEELKQLRNIIRRRIYVNPKVEASIVDRFHTLYYDSVAFGKT